MTDNLPAVPDPAPQREIATIDTDSWVAVMRPILALAEKVYNTDFVPRGLRGNEPATAAAMLYGREVGLPPMTALNMTHVVEGKPGLSAEGMRAVVLAKGHDLEFVESTGAICTMRARRRGGDNWTTVTWTIDAARQAGLANKGVWKSYPRVMLQARCTTEICRMVFPDVIHGFRSLEELQDMEPGDTADTGAAPAADTGSTKVVRRATRKKPPTGQPAALSAAPVEAPPLPGEDGYDDPTPQTTEQPAETTEQPTAPPEPAAPVESDDDTPSSHDAGAGNDTEDTTSTAPAATSPAADTDADPAPEEEGEATNGAGPAVVRPGPMTRPQDRMLRARFTELGVDPDDRDERLLICSTILGVDVTSSKTLSRDQASQLIDTLARFRDRAGLNAFLDELDAARGQGADGIVP